MALTVLLSMEDCKVGANHVAFGAFFPTGTTEKLHRAEPRTLEWWADQAVLNHGCAARIGDGRLFNDARLPAGAGQRPSGVKPRDTDAYAGLGGEWRTGAIGLAFLPG
jgi:hypothetical protein